MKNLQTLCKIAAICGVSTLTCMSSMQPAGAIEAIQNYTPSGRTNTTFNGTVGSSFTINSDTTVNSLGVYDTDQDGLLGSFEVGMWDTSQNLLGSVTVPSGSSATLRDGFRYQDLSSPINLTSGQQYVIGALYTGSAHEGFDNYADINDEWTSTLISSPQERYTTGDTLSFPILSSASGSNQAFIGPNFSDTSTAVPFELNPTLGFLAILSWFGGKKAYRYYCGKKISL